MTAHLSDGFALTDLTLGYGGAPVVEKLNLDLEPGCTALVGPNGSGKSTLLAGLAKLLRPERGRIDFDGRDLIRIGAKDLARRVALLAQAEVPPTGIDVRALVSYGRFPYRKPLRGLTAQDNAIIDRALERCGIVGLADRQVSELSGGQIQRVWLACVLAQDTDWILADEPTTYLDLGHQTAVLRLLRSLHDDSAAKVIMVLHDLNQAIQYADHLVVLAEGKIVAQGAPADVIDEQLLREVYGVEATIGRHPDNGLPLVIPAV